MKVSVYNQKAEVVGDVELNPRIFDVKASIHLLAEAVRIHQANARQGTSHTKTRGAVSGGGKKPWKQKGTGRARAGSIRSPIWRGGGITFGPQSNQNWELKMNKKAKTKALFMSLSDKVKNNRFIVIDSISFDQPKTKEFVKFMAAFKTSVKDLGKKHMIVMPKKDEKLVKASRNIPNMMQTIASSLNIFDIMKADSMIVLKDSLPVIEKIYLKAQSEIQNPKSEKAPKAKLTQKA